MPDTIQAATGQGEGPWSGLLSAAGQVARTGADVYRAVTRPEEGQATTPINNATPPPAPTANGWTRYLPWIIGAVVALVVLGMFLKRK